MTIVRGQIESLKRLKAELNRRGIKRFNSTGEINAFVEGYESERLDALRQIEHALDIEIATLQADISKLHKYYDDLKTAETSILNNKIDSLKHKYDLISAANVNAVFKVFNFLELLILKYRRSRLERNFNTIIVERTFSAAQEVFKTNWRLDEYTTNRAKVISDRSNSKIRDLEYTKEVVDGLYPLIAGAIGEKSVVNELSKLSDKNILFNDFSIDFDKPIYNAKEKDRIFSIQIDHLLVTNSGIFIIETKNWSKASIENLDLRSPIQQIRRSNFALFVVLNGSSRHEGIKLKAHHWGDKQLPIRNLVVMISNKPKEKFKFVEVKTLNELNGYITYFDPILDDSEVNRVSEYLESIKN